MPYSRPQLTAYLQRIGIEGGGDGEGRQLLAAVLRAHRLAIPFENLDIPLGRGIPLDPEHLFDKLVTRRRGGYCFEQNSLFLGMLRQLGFEPRPLLARVWLRTEDTPPRTHMLNLIATGGVDLIADVGFGGGYTPLIPLEEGHSELGPDDVRHRLRRDAAHGWMLERDAGAGWMPQYSFTLDPAWPADLESANHWTSTRPGTRFTTLCIISIALADGFASLVDGALTVRTAETAHTSEIGDAATYRAALAEQFKLELTHEEVSALPLFSN